MTRARGFAASALARITTVLGDSLSVSAIIAASLVGLHSWADGAATSVPPDDRSQGITG